MKAKLRAAVAHVTGTGLVGDISSLEARYEPPGFPTLCRIIAYQQVAGAHASRVVESVEEHYQGHLPDVDEFLTTGAAQVYERCGVAAFRTKRMHTIAEEIHAGNLTLPDRDEPTVHDQLVAIKGVGEWTASMYRLFALQSLDIWTTSDVGIIKGLAIHRNKPIETIKANPGNGNGWQPYRTVAMWFLWQSVPGFPTPGFRRAPSPKDLTTWTQWTTEEKEPLHARTPSRKTHEALA